jgi:hypothetical protein
MQPNQIRARLVYAFPDLSSLVPLSPPRGGRVVLSFFHLISPITLRADTDLWNGSCLELSAMRLRM